MWVFRAATKARVSGCEGKSPDCFARPREHCDFPVRTNGEARLDAPASHGEASVQSGVGIRMGRDFVPTRRRNSHSFAWRSGVPRAQSLNAPQPPGASLPLGPAQPDVGMRRHGLSTRAANV
jgi:hypothetical protein